MLTEWRAAILKSRKLSAETQHLLLTLTRHLNVWGQIKFPDIRFLVAQAELQPKSIEAALNEAIEAGWIVLEESTGDSFKITAGIPSGKKKRLNKN